MTNKKISFLSGELHYFRVAPSEWRNRMRDAKEAGLNTISTYIPWNWHEVDEGSFDFSGSTHPQRNLELFLETAEEEGMLLIAKPGPYICAEWLYGGVPAWLIENHPEIRALSSSGKPTKWLSRKAPAITYLHPVYLKFAERWMKEVSRVIGKHQASEGGCIAVVQVDNESSYGFHFHPFDVDYNPVVIGDGGSEGLYQKWLRLKFSSVKQLNRTYEANYSDFSEVRPPRSLKEYAFPAVLDWLEFKEQMISDFLCRMVRTLETAGINTPLVTNEFFIPFFYPPIQAKSQVLLDAVNLYPHYLDEESLLTVINYLELFKGYQPGAPLLVTELQSGWFSYRTSKNTLHILSRIAHMKGAQGINFYMFSGGINPKGFGTTGKFYFRDAPVSPDGKRTDKYHVVKLVTSLINSSSTMTPIYDLHVAYYHRYALAEIAGGQDLFRRKFRVLASSFRHLLLSLLKSGISYSITPLTTVTPRHSPLLFNAFNFISEDASERLISFVENGGTLIMLPQIPVLNEENRPFNDLTETLCVERQKTKRGIVSFAGHKMRLSPVTVFDAKDVEPLAFLENGELAGFRVRIGKGEVVQLGFTPCTALSLTKVALKASQVCVSNQVTAFLSKGVNGYGLFVCNLERRRVDCMVLLQLPEYQSSLKFTLPARSGATWPVKRKFTYGEILHATAELVKSNKSNLTFWSYEGLQGEIKLKLRKPPLKKPENSYWDRKRKTLKVTFFARKGKITLMEDPFELVIIGVGPFSLESARERLLTAAQRWLLKKFLGY